MFNSTETFILKELIFIELENLSEMIESYENNERNEIINHKEILLNILTKLDSNSWKYFHLFSIFSLVS